MIDVTRGCLNDRPKIGVSRRARERNDISDVEVAQDEGLDGSVRLTEQINKRSHVVESHLGAALFVAQRRASQRSGRRERAKKGEKATAHGLLCKVKVRVKARLRFLVE